MLFCSAALPLSRQIMSYTVGSFAATAGIPTPWHNLGSGQQALLVPVYLRKSETFVELAAGLVVGTATVWRYVTETVVLLVVCCRNCARLRTRHGRPDAPT